VALVVVAVVAGMLAGRLLRPLRYRHLAPPRPRWVAVALAGVVVATVAERLDGDAAVRCALVGQALLVAGVVANLHLVGAGVLAIGLGCNLVSMAVDSGVPVRPAALVEAGVVARAELDAATLTGPRHLEGDDDLLGVLGDAIPLSAFGTVVSFGDLIALVGIADVATHAARPHRRRRARRADESVVIDLRGHVRTDEEVEAMLRHPTARDLVTT
jgi:hypothetical protein